MRSFGKIILPLLFILLLFLPETVYSQCIEWVWGRDPVYSDCSCGVNDICSGDEICVLDWLGKVHCAPACGQLARGGGWWNSSVCQSDNLCGIWSVSGSAALYACYPLQGGGGGGGSGGGGSGNPSCKITVDYVSPQAVWPVIPEKQQPYGYSEDWNNSTIMVSLNEPAPPEGCTVRFSVEPVKDSGEHIESNHTGARQTGSVSPSLITFPAGSSGAATVIYTSSEVSGVDKIIIEADDGNVKNVVREEWITVRVPRLVELGEGEGYDLMPQPDKGHPYNHFGKLDTFSVLWDIAASYFETEKGTLRINDISLPLGGAFDICGKWDPKLTCDTYKYGGHNTHRLGEDVDIDDITTEKNMVTEESLEEIIKYLDYVDNVIIFSHKDHFHLSISFIKAKKVTPPPPMPPDVIPQ